MGASFFAMDGPFFSLIYVGVAVYVFRLWWQDRKQWVQTGQVQPGSIPGATVVGWGVVVVGVIGSLLILGVEIGGEYALGIVEEQSEMIWWLIFPVLAAPIIEEVIFRGYLVIDKKGKAILYGSIFGFSVLFAVVHGHLIGLGEEGESFLVWKGSAKGWFTTGILLSQSLWWYALRFCPWNPHRSILPSMIAHFAVNLGVIVTKGFQGFLQFPSLT